MVSCIDFLRDYTDYRDGMLSAAGSAAMDAHLAACASCERYDEVVARGVRELRAVPELTPSDDFLPRLQHRIYHVEEERTWWSRRDASGTSVSFVALIVLLFGLAAWLPLLRPQPPLVELPAVAALAPRKEVPVHALFRTGPILVQPAVPAISAGITAPAHHTLLFRYTPLGSYAGYSVETSAPR